MTKLPLFVEYIIKNVIRYRPFHVVILYELFIEFTENVLHRDIYRYRDNELPISGYDILVISHSPSDGGSTHEG